MQTIGKYQVLDVIGYGGMGVVYRARDNAIGRQVALKVMSAALAQQPELRERFLREARSAGNLDHPNIVIIHDLGEHEGAPYIAMEYLAGKPLDKALADASLSLPQKLGILTQVCDGLQYAHERGIVHRDVKPANVLVLPDGRAKLVDFGIARTGEGKLTKTGMIMGTIAYMAPEQIRGKQVDARSDVFSAGVMLYELVAGKMPFEGESTAETMMKILQEEPAELRVDGVISPEALAAVVRGALAKDPAQRFQSAREFGDAIRDYLRAQERSASTPTVVRSRQELTGAATAGAAPRPPQPAATQVPPTITGRAPEPQAPEFQAAASPQPRVAPKPTGKRVMRWVLGSVVALFVLAGLFGWWVVASFKAEPHRVLGSVQLRLVATANPEAADKFQLKDSEQSYDLERSVIVDESGIESANADSDENGRPRVLLHLTSEGAARLRNASTANIGKQLAIVVGGELVEVATIQEPLGEFVAITGRKTPAEAQDLANRINGRGPTTSAPAPQTAPSATTSTESPPETATPGQAEPARSGSAPAAAPQKVKIAAGVVQGNLLSAPKPEYPPLAKTARIQGPVVMHALIGKDGHIRELKVLSGHPMLTQAAMDAVKQWRYKPYMLNGEPVEVETNITVNFQLDTGPAGGGSANSRSARPTNRSTSSAKAS